MMRWCELRAHHTTGGRVTAACARAILGAHALSTSSARNGHALARRHRRAIASELAALVREAARIVHAGISTAAQSRRARQLRRRDQPRPRRRPAVRRAPLQILLPQTTFPGKREPRRTAASRRARAALPTTATQSRPTRRRLDLNGAQQCAKRLGARARARCRRAAQFARAPLRGAQAGVPPVQARNPRAADERAAGRRRMRIAGVRTPRCHHAAAAASRGARRPPALRVSSPAPPTCRTSQPPFKYRRRAL